MPDDSNPTPASPLSDFFDLLGRAAADPAVASDEASRLPELVAELPPVIRDLLATSARQGEAVLSYAGKQTRGEILGAPQVAPLQVLRRFVPGEDGERPGESDWVNKLIFGDNLGVLRRLVTMKRNGELRNSDGTQGVRCIYIDPPFATTREFARGDGTTAYSDRKDGAEFIEFLRHRLVLLHELLADDGSLWVHLDQRKTHYAKVVLDEIFGEANFRREVVWRSASGTAEAGATRPTKVHETILLYTKNKGIWNEERVPVPPDAEIVARDYTNVDADGRRWRTIPMKTARGVSKHHYTFQGKPAPREGWRVSEADMQKLFDEGRLHIGNGKLIYKKGYLDEHPGYQLPDLWDDIGWVRSKDKYPTEKPASLLERVIRTTSNPGDLVLDCFAGSGSTLRAAEKLGRRWIGVDVGKLAIHTATRDLLRTTRHDGNPAAPFDVIHAGLYDADQLTSRPFEDWHAFVLALYQARVDQHTVADVHIDGRRGPRGREKVIVYDYTTNPDAVIDDTWLRELHTRLSRALRRCVVSVIVPQHLTPTLVADSYTAGGLTVRILRVPPSMASAVAGGFADGFAELSQPVSAKHVNALVNSDGFDFILPPTLNRTLTIARTKPRVTLTSFTADGRRGPNTPLPDDGRDDLALVLIDYDHDADRFDFDDVVWVGDMREATPAWTVSLDAAALTSPTAITWIDRFGNEQTEVITPDQWPARKDAR